MPRDDWPPDSFEARALQAARAARCRAARGRGSSGSGAAGAGGAVCAPDGGGVRGALVLGTGAATRARHRGAVWRAVLRPGRRGGPTEPGALGVGAMPALRADVRAAPGAWSRRRGRCAGAAPGASAMQRPRSGRRGRAPRVRLVRPPPPTGANRPPLRLRLPTAPTVECGFPAPAVGNGVVRKRRARISGPRLANGRSRCVGQVQLSDRCPRRCAGAETPRAPPLVRGGPRCRW